MSFLRRHGDAASDAHDQESSARLASRRLLGAGRRGLGADQECFVRYWRGNARCVWDGGLVDSGRHGRRALRAAARLVSGFEWRRELAIADPSESAIAVACPISWLSSEERDNRAGGSASDPCRRFETPAHG